METMHDDTRRAGALRRLVIPLVWLLASVVSSARGGFEIGLHGTIRRIAWTTLFREQLFAYGWWALLSPAIVWSVRRIAAIPSLAARVIVHTACAATFVLIDYLLLAYLNFGQAYGLDRTWAGVRSILPEAVALYALIAIATLALLAQERARKATELERQLFAARLQVLRAQLHPHFLFNSLHAISALIDFRPKDARRMLAGLGELLRETVDFIDQTEVPLGREIDWLEQYVELQQLRYEERLTVDFDIAPQVVSALVPPLILQPLVENAIKHSIEPRSAGGRIVISATRDGARLILRVHDDGAGVKQSPAGGGVGLRNTRERLSALHDDDCSLELRDAADGGAEAVVSLPFRAAQSMAVVA
jgi:two-component system LytT family sensor kinase